MPQSVWSVFWSSDGEVALPETGELLSSPTITVVTYTVSDEGASCLVDLAITQNSSNVPKFYSYEMQSSDTENTNYTVTDFVSQLFPTCTVQQR